MNDFWAVFGLLELLISLGKGIMWLISFIFGWWADLWTGYYDKKIPLSPIWARVLGIVCSVLTHPVVVIPAVVFMVSK